MHFGMGVLGIVMEEARAAVLPSSLVIATLLHGSMKSYGRTKLRLGEAGWELQKAALDRKSGWLEDHTKSPSCCIDH